MTSDSGKQSLESALLKNSENNEQDNRRRVNFWCSEVYSKISGEIHKAMSPPGAKQKWQDILKKQLKDPNSSLNKALVQAKEWSSNPFGQDLVLDESSTAKFKALQGMMEVFSDSQPNVSDAKAQECVEWISNQRFDAFVSVFPQKTIKHDGEGKTVTSDEITLEHLRKELDFGDLFPHQMRFVAEIHFDINKEAYKTKDFNRFFSVESMKESIEAAKKLPPYPSVKAMKENIRKELEQKLVFISKEKSRKSIDSLEMGALTDAIFRDVAILMKRQGFNSDAYLKKEISGAMQQLKWVERYDALKAPRFIKLEDQYTIREKVLKTLAERIKAVAQIEDIEESKSLAQAQNVLTDVFDEFKEEQKKKGSVAQKRLGNFRLQTDSKDIMRKELTSKLQELLKQGMSEDALKEQVIGMLSSKVTRKVLKRPSITSEVAEELSGELDKIELKQSEVAYAPSVEVDSSPKSERDKEKQPEAKSKYASMEEFLAADLGSDRTAKTISNAIRTQKKALSTKLSALEQGLGGSDFDSLFYEAKEELRRYQDTLGKKCISPKNTGANRVSRENNLKPLAEAELEVIEKEVKLLEREHYSLEAAKAAEVSSQSREEVRKREEYVEEREKYSLEAAKAANASYAIRSAERLIEEIEGAIEEEIVEEEKKSAIEEIDVPKYTIVVNTENIKESKLAEAEELVKEAQKAALGLSEFEEKLKVLESRWKSIDTTMEALDIDPKTRITPKQALKLSKQDFKELFEDILGGKGVFEEVEELVIEKSKQWLDKFRELNNGSEKDYVLYFQKSAPLQNIEKDMNERLDEIWRQIDDKAGKYLQAEKIQEFPSEFRAELKKNFEKTRQEFKEALTGENPEPLVEAYNRLKAEDKAKEEAKAKGPQPDAPTPPEFDDFDELAAMSEIPEDKINQFIENGLKGLENYQLKSFSDKGWEVELESDTTMTEALKSADIDPDFLNKAQLDLILAARTNQIQEKERGHQTLSQQGKPVLTLDDNRGTGITIVDAREIQEIAEVFRSNQAGIDEPEQEKKPGQVAESAFDNKENDLPLSVKQEVRKIMSESTKTKPKASEENPRTKVLRDRGQSGSFSHS